MSNSPNMGYWYDKESGPLALLLLAPFSAQADSQLGIIGANQNPLQRTQGSNQGPSKPILHATLIFSPTAENRAIIYKPKNPAQSPCRWIIYEDARFDPDNSERRQYKITRW